MMPRSYSVMNLMALQMLMQSLAKLYHLMCPELSLRLGSGRWSQGRMVYAMRRKEGGAVSDWSKHGVAVPEIL